MIELQERKRQLLKARAEYHASDKNDVLNAWDDEDDKKEIPDDIQVIQMISRYLQDPNSAHKLA